MESQIDYETAKFPENHAVVHENRRFRERNQNQANTSDHATHYSNIKQFSSGQRKFEAGMWLDVKDTID